ncbi:aldose 1-epimerase [Candidatus Moduliflexus flocculans]|uniref:Aldose 1-epimerase n=1 Tax=Candidatus Moduliflexus flocculans TaxID=1499966 RepID=A0A0S6VQZ5_9BACT|nr:aldose 1-epimerase [Candidatus Moduliflexus flocculans]
MNVTKQFYGKTHDGVAVDLYTLQNDHGGVVSITNYGGIIVSWHVPDRHGKFDDILLGFETFEGFLGEHPYFGALIGRYGNRIEQGKFTLNGVEYTLAKNNGHNHLHGGLKGFDKVVWKATEVRRADGVGVELHYLSKDGEEGYPGNLNVTVVYVFTNDQALKIEYTATTDNDTVLNLTNHAYFNLCGALSGKNVLGHELTIQADAFTPGDAGLIPTGEIRSVKGTPMDFTKPAPIGARIKEDYEPLHLAGGYDHNYVLNKSDQALTLAAQVYEPTSGRVMEVHTTEPGIQLYTGNFLDGTITGKGGVAYHQHSGFCLETQHFPNSPNRPNFPSTTLKPGETYTQTTIYTFSVKK